MKKTAMRCWASRVLMLLVFGFLGSACSETPKYGYVPVSHQVNAGKLRGEAIYSVPENSPPGSVGPSGNVRIFSTGVVDIKSKEVDAKPFPAIHIRMAISNQSGNQAWTLNTQNQVISFPNNGQIAPVFVNSDSHTVPSLEIHPGELRTLDLYYELPAAQESQKSVRDVPEFDFRWQIQAGAQLVSEATPFDRIPIPERRDVLYPYEPYPIVLGVGAVWWGPRPGFHRFR